MSNMIEKDEENLPVTRMDLEGLSEKVAQQGMSNRTGIPVESPVRKEINQNRGKARSGVWKLLIAAGIFGAGYYVGSKHPQLPKNTSDTASTVHDGVKEALPLIEKSVEKTQNSHKGIDEEPTISSPEELIRQLKKYGYLAESYEFPDSKYLSGMILRPEKKKDIGFAWGPLDKLQQVTDKDVIALKVTNPALRNLLEVRGAKYKIHAFKDGIDYYYYDCANFPKNQTSIALRDPSSNKRRYLDVINLILTACSDDTK